MKKAFVIIILVVLLFTACADSEAAPTLAITAIPSPVGELPPTFTPPRPEDRFNVTEAVVTVTQPVIPTRPTDTPIPFGDTAVEIRYQIPSLGLDRRMQGSISSQLILVDEVAGTAVKRNGQAGVLLELQQLLPELLLPVIPDGCDGCVFISYELPFANLQDEGWLRDPVLLASLENYLSIGLGPHFPEGTVVGLRRSASPFAPAHSVALTEDGLVYSWLAIDSEVGEPVPADPALIAAFAALEINRLDSQYVTPCQGYPLETMILRKNDVEGGLGILCPEYTLPSTLLPLYSQLDAVLAEKLAASDAVLERPATAIPLTAVLDYERVDGAKMTIFDDGTTIARDTENNEITTYISPTQVVSLTTGLISSGAIRTGLNSFGVDATLPVTSTNGVSVTLTATPKPPRTVLLVRGPGGLYDGEWFNTFDIPELAVLNEMLVGMFADAVLPEAEETAVPETNETPETPEAETTVTPEQTTTPEATATP